VRARAASPPDLASSAEEDSGISFDMAISEDEDEVAVHAEVQERAPLSPPFVSMTAMTALSSLSSYYYSRSHAPAVQPQVPKASVETFIRAQAFDRPFIPSSLLYRFIGNSEDAPHTPQELVKANNAELIWFTVLRITYLEAKFADEKEVWEFVMEKAWSCIKESIEQVVSPEGVSVMKESRVKTRRNISRHEAVASFSGGTLFHLILGYPFCDYKIIKQ